MHGFIECLLKKKGYTFTMHDGSMEEIIDWLIEKSPYKNQIAKAVIVEDKKASFKLMAGLRID